MDIFKAPYKPAICDSHMHLDILEQGHPEAIKRLVAGRCLCISWAWGQQIANMDDLVAYLDLQAQTVRNLREKGLYCFYLTGVHPRNICPDLVAEKLPQILLPRLDDPLCLGIGEIGLETGKGPEKKVLAAQLDLAREVFARNKIIGIHTPRMNKEKTARTLLDFLDRFVLDRKKVVIDHVTPRIAGEILNRGYFAGVSLCPGKTSPIELLTLCRDQWEHLDRILVNTDCGNSFFDDLLRLPSMDILPPQTLARTSLGNGLAFYGI
ncbi:MAG: TatD family hydrolase [Desulfatibacillaceae bacterium]|nr:TatD family hydrolase [Desulfatibacillaceae bacterium]